MYTGNTVHILVCEGNVTEFTFARLFYMFVSDVLLKLSKIVPAFLNLHL